MVGRMLCKETTHLLKYARHKLIHNMYEVVLRLQATQDTLL